MKGDFMNTTTTLHKSLKLALIAPMALACLSVSPHARADSLLLAQTTLVSGSVSTVDSFTAPTAGAVTVTLTDLKWPASLSALSFSATSANHVLASWSASGTSMSGGTATFDVGAGTYFAHIMATAASGFLDMGLYSLSMTFTPSAVPLPAAGWMLLTGMFVLAGLARVVRPVELTGTAAA